MQKSLREKNKKQNLGKEWSLRIYVINFKMYYEVASNKTVWYRHQDR